MKKGVKILIIAICVIAVLVGGYFLTLAIIRGSALKHVDNMFGAIKSGDQTQIEQYIESSEDSSSNDEQTIKKEDEELFKTMLGNVNYKVISTKTKFNKVNVKLEVTNKDINKVLQTYFTKVFSLAFSDAFDENNTEEDLANKTQDYLKELYNSDEIQTQTNELNLELVKESGKWKINYDKNEFLNAILPGIGDISNSLSGISE